MAIRIASETDEASRPIHLFEALAVMTGPVAAMLTSPHGAVLYPRADVRPAFRGGQNGHLAGQAVGSARNFAESRSEKPGPQHLLLALIDQGDAEALNRLQSIGIDLVGLREGALSLLNLPNDHPPIPLVPRTPAGYWDRPLLEVEELDSTAWELLTWRQQHLPLARLRDLRDWEYLKQLEWDTADRLRENLHLDDDHELSLPIRHLELVDAIGLAGRPDIVPQPLQPLSPRTERTVSVRYPRFRRRRRFRITGRFRFRGWGTWFANRWEGIRS